MSDSFIFAYGPEGRTLNVDASGRIIATQEPYDAFYIYGYGDTGRSLVVDGSGRLGITIDNVDDNTTASNLGTGSGVYSAKVGDDLRFKSITAGDNVSISGSATEIRISSASGTGGSSDAALRTDFTNASGKWTSDIAENTQGVLDFDNASGVWTADISSNAANISGVDTDFTNASGYWETLIADAGSVDFANASGNMAAAIDLNTAGRIDFTNASGNMVAATTAAQAAADAVQTDFTNASGYWEDLITDAEGEGLDFANASGNMVATTTAAQAAADDVTTDFTNISGVWESEINLNTQGVLDFNNSSGVIGSAGLEVGGNVWTPVSSGTVDENETINLSLSDVHRLHWMDGINSTLTLSNPKTGGKYTFVLVNAQGGDGAVVWPAEVLWQNGDGMTSLTPGTNSIDVVGMTYDGENYFAASGCAFA